MTASAAGSSRKTLRSLWRRAPLWRFALIVASLLTVLFVLFPPKPHTKQTPNISAQASYMSPRPVSHNETVQSAFPITPPAVQPTLPPASSALQSPESTSVQLPKSSSSVAASSSASLNESGTGLDPALLGRSYSGSVQVNGFELPLPEGNWFLIANTNYNTPTVSGAIYFFGRLRDRHLIGAITAAAIRARSSSDTVQNIVNKSAGCGERYYLFMADSNKDQSACWYVSNFFAPGWSRWADGAVKLDDTDRTAGKALAAKGIDFPQDFISVQFVRTESWGLLHTKYLFSPEIAGIKSNTAPTFADSDWSPKMIKRFPEKVAYVEKLKTWAASFWPQYQAAFAAGQ